MLTAVEDTIIQGTLLGDAHIQKRGLGSFRLKISHSIKQAQLVDIIEPVILEIPDMCYKLNKEWRTP